MEIFAPARSATWYCAEAASLGYEIQAGAEVTPAYEEAHRLLSAAVEWERRAELLPAAQRRALGL